MILQHVYQRVQLLVKVRQALVDIRFGSALLAFAALRDAGHAALDGVK
jgi:hypothetical protein